MTLLVIAVKPTLWPVSTVCPFLLLSVCLFYLHAETEDVECGSVMVNNLLVVLTKSVFNN